MVFDSGLSDECIGFIVANEFFLTFFFLVCIQLFYFSTVIRFSCTTPFLKTLLDPVCVLEKLFSL